MDQALSELQNIYKKGDLVLFVGAGVSSAAGLPSWAELVKVLAEYARSKGVSEDILDEVAELVAARKFIDALAALKDALSGTEFCKCVEKQLDDNGRPIPPAAEAIAELSDGLRAILTTNIDRILDRALRGKWPILSRATLDIAQRRGFLLKLHGTLLERDTWVFTRSDYDRAMYADPKMQTSFSALFHGSTLLFVGYGLADDDFDQILAKVRALAGDQPPQHFAIVPRDAVRSYRRKLLEGSGVSLIVYENKDGTHGELVSLLRAIATGTAPDVSESARSNTKSQVILPGVSTLAQKIADERGFAWEARLFSQVLADGLRAAQALRRDLTLGVAFGELTTLEGADTLGWMSSQFKSIERIAVGLAQLVNVGLADAMGPPGKPGDPEKIVYVADRICHAYREAIAWAMRWKHLRVEAIFERLVEFGPSAAEHLLGVLEQWSARIQETLDDCVRNKDKLPSGSEIDLSVVLDLPDGWEATMTREMNRVASEYRYR